MRKLSLLAVATLVTAIFPIAPPAGAQVPDGDPTDLPVLSRQVPRGSGSAETQPDQASTPKTVDGDISDWTGEATRYGGTSVYSSGELIYQDHLFDAHGPDDGRDAARLERTKAARETVPETYRVESIAQADLSGEFGIPFPEQITYNGSYGDATAHQDHADLEEVRVAADGNALYLLARTTTMTAPGETGLLLLASSGETGAASAPVPFNAGIESVADKAFFIADGVVLGADVSGGGTTAVEGASAVANQTDFVNAIEARIPLDALGAAGGGLTLSLASGTPDASRTGFAKLDIETQNDSPHANLANVAFRNEPVRLWFDEKQALALFAGTIDEFRVEVDLARLTSGATESFQPGPGYHDRIFRSDSTPGVAQEGGRNGLFQHYGVYLPTEYDGTSSLPLHLWLHWRGGTAHSGGAIVPKVFKHFGEDEDTIVIAPSGRGTSTWYVGRGHVDVLEAWDDALETFAIDESRTYVAGHSMGGWGSYLFPLVYPDRFAGAAPAAGAVTQGGWLGLDCSSCYFSENDGRARDQHSHKLLENARHVPYAILQGTNDELIWWWSVALQAQRLAELGYRHRLYTYPGYEHYSHPIADQWAETASYLHRFTTPKNPARVSYRRDMLFEIATEQVQSSGATLNFDFDSAYWMSQLTPVDMAKGMASFEGRSLAIPEQPYIVAPDTAPPTAPGQTGPYVITGLQWLNDPSESAPAPANAFEATLTGASAVRLDLQRMNIDVSKVVAGAVTASDALDLRLAGGWATAPDVSIDGEPVAAQLQDGVLTIVVPAGSHSLTITPGQAPPQEVITAVAFTPDSDDSAQYSDTATLQAQLTGTEGTPIANQQLDFTLGSSSASAITGSDGIATVQVPVNDAPGDPGASVSFAGRPGEFTSAIASTAFRIEKEDSATALVVTGKGSKRKLVATVTDADSAAPLKEVQVVFTANGTEIGTATTNNNGVATLNAPPGYRGNGITFTATFGGNTFFVDSSDTEIV